MKNLNDEYCWFDFDKPCPFSFIEIAPLNKGIVELFKVAIGDVPPVFQLFAAKANLFRQSLQPAYFSFRSATCRALHGFTAYRYSMPSEMLLYLKMIPSSMQPRTGLFAVR